MESLLNNALAELKDMTSSLKKELDETSLEQIDYLIDTFKKMGTRPDEVLFLQSLIALKITQKNLESTHHFNREVAHLTRASVK